MIMTSVALIRAAAAWPGLKSISRADGEDGSDLRRFGYFPVPDKLVLRLFGVASSETISTAVRLPVARGLNLILMLQVPPDARVVPQLVEDWTKSPGSAPANVTAEIFRVLGKLFRRVAVFAKLVIPTFVLRKVTVDGYRVT
jgi:hypothetical protein